MVVICNVLYEVDFYISTKYFFINSFWWRNSHIQFRPFISININKIFLPRPVLKEIWRSGATHFVMDCSSEILGDVLKQAQQVGLVTHQHHYIITNLDLHTIDLTPFQYSETNITGVSDYYSIFDRKAILYNFLRNVPDKEYKLS